jgi:DNA repair ATPase RecN
MLAFTEAERLALISIAVATLPATIAAVATILVAKMRSENKQQHAVASAERTEAQQQLSKEVLEAKEIAAAAVSAAAATTAALLGHTAAEETRLRSIEERLDDLAGVLRPFVEKLTSTTPARGVPMIESATE